MIGHPLPREVECDDRQRRKAVAEGGFVENVPTAISKSATRALLVAIRT